MGRGAGRLRHHFPVDHVRAVRIVNDVDAGAFVVRATDLQQLPAFGGFDAKGSDPTLQDDLTLDIVPIGLNTDYGPFALELGWERHRCKSLPSRIDRPLKARTSRERRRRQSAGPRLTALRPKPVVRASATMIQIGDRIPEATLFESTEFGEACPVSPARVSVAEASRGKRIAIFGLPGAYTPTCSAKHVPGYIALYDQLRAHKVDEIWCLSVNDGYVMAAWGREQNALGKVRMLGDGSGELTKKLGLDQDLSGRAWGRAPAVSRCWSMTVSSSSSTSKPLASSRYPTRRRC